MEVYKNVKQGKHKSFYSGDKCHAHGMDTVMFCDDNHKVVIQDGKKIIKYDLLNKTTEDLFEWDGNEDDGYSFTYVQSGHLIVLDTDKLRVIDTSSEDKTVVSELSPADCGLEKDYFWITTDEEDESSQAYIGKGADEKSAFIIDYYKDPTTVIKLDLKKIGKDGFVAKTVTLDFPCWHFQVDSEHDSLYISSGDEPTEFIVLSIDSLEVQKKIGEGLRNAPNFFFSKKHKKLFAKDYLSEYIDILEVSRNLTKDVSKRRIPDVIQHRLFGIPERDLLFSAGFGGTKSAFQKMGNLARDSQINVFDMKSDNLLASVKVDGGRARMAASSGMD